MLSLRRVYGFDAGHLLFLSVLGSQGNRGILDKPRCEEHVGSVGATDHKHCPQAIHCPRLSLGHHCSWSNLDMLSLILRIFYRVHVIVKTIVKTSSS